MKKKAVDPRNLKITDMRFVDIDGAPKRCTLLKIFTNQGLVGYGEVRDASSKTYALMLKSRILGENPCDVDRIFHKIKQFVSLDAYRHAFERVCGFIIEPRHEIHADEHHQHIFHHLEVLLVHLGHLAVYFKRQIKEFYL